MKKRNPYKTAQQEAMLQYFLEDLERQALEGSVIKIQPVDGSGTQYWRLPCPQADLRGKLVCLKCRKVIPLSCEHLDMFSEHVLHKHKFNLSLQHSILYGYCEDCDN